MKAAWGNHPEENTGHKRGGKDKKMKKQKGKKIVYFFNFSFTYIVKLDVVVVIIIIKILMNKIKNKQLINLKNKYIK